MESFFDFLFLLITIFSASLQIYLFFVVLFKSPKNMSEYRLFLCCFTFWDCFYNITVGLIIMPGFCPPSPSATIHGLGRHLVDWFGYNANKFMFAMSVWGAADTIQLQTWCLMYRFCAINSNTKLLEYFMSWPSLIIFHIIGYSLTFSLAIPAYMSVVDESQIQTAMSAFPPETFGGSYDQKAIILINVRSFQNLIVYIFALFVLATVLGFAMAAHIIFYLTKHAASFTQKTYKMHLQLTVILVVQQITPIICVMLPLTAAGVMGLQGRFHEISKTAYNLGFVLLALYPSSNALICIIFITPYWTFTKNWIFTPFYRLKLVKPKNDPNPVIVGPSTSLSFSLVG